MVKPTYPIGIKVNAVSALLLLGFWANPALAQAPQPSAPPSGAASDSAASGSSGPPPAATAGSPEATAPIVVVPPESPAPAPSAETTIVPSSPSQASLAPTVVSEPLPASAQSNEPNDWLPPGERQKMAAETVGFGDVRFVPGEGLSITSADGRFSMGFGFRFQLLYTLLDQDPATGKTDESIQIRRARVQLAGHAFGKHNKYRLELAVSPSDVDTNNGTVRQSPLLEAYTEFDYLRDLTVRAGQYKVPYDRMRVASDMVRQLVDYSAVTGEFSLDRDIGVELKSSDLFGLGLLRYHLGVFSGEGRNSYAPSDLGMLYVARVEVLPLGLFDDYTEGDFQRTGPRLSVGGAYAHLENGKKDRGTTGNVPLDTGTTDFDMAEGDASFKVRGFSLLGGVYYRHGNRTPGSLVDATGAPILDAKGKAITGPTASRDGVGLVAQAGYLLPQTSFEVAARYANQTGRTVQYHDGLKDMTELGGGLNYYFAQHQLKLQTDYFRIYPKDGISSGYNQLRVQLQLVL